MKHEMSATKQVGGIELRYSTKNWSDKFVCPVCGNARRFSLNFLGGRRVPMCDGEQIKAGQVLDYATYRARKATAA